MGISRRQNIIVRLGLLQNAPHAIDVIARVSPIALGIEVSQKEPVLKTQMDCRDRARDFPRHKGLGPGRSLMVEQDSIRGMYSVGFSVIDRDPVSVKLGGGVRRARIKWRRLVLRSRL